MDPIRIAVVGLGKIARDQHVPAIAGNADFTLTATVSPDGSEVAGVPYFATLDALLADGPAVDAVALCTPPQARYALAATALARGLHVLLEKPPGATLTEVDALCSQAEAAGAVLFSAWHSRFAGGVAGARAWLADRRVVKCDIVWREDVRVWHPGQNWIWEAGGLGVFDPGINALSIATYILPRRFFLQAGMLEIPANRDAPISANLAFYDTSGVPVTVDLDFRQTGPQRWDIIVETDAGICTLENGGAVLTLPTGTTRHDDREYPDLYAHFAALIDTGRSDVDTAPLKLVADTFLRARRQTVAPFEY